MHEREHGHDSGDGHGHTVTGTRMVPVMVTVAGTVAVIFSSFHLFLKHDQPSALRVCVTNTGTGMGAWVGYM